MNELLELYNFPKTPKKSATIYSLRMAINKSWFVQFAKGALNISLLLNDNSNYFNEPYF